jgi:hypothetical protein
MNRLAREIVFPDAVNPSLDAAGNAPLRFTPGHTISRAYLVFWRVHREHFVACDEPMDCTARGMTCDHFVVRRDQGSRHAIG